jgi:signal peptidase I
VDGKKSLLREYLEALLIAILFATFARTFVVQAFKIPSGSMERNLLIGDHILVNKFVYGPTAFGLERALLPVRDVRRGDVVVFKYPDDPSRDFIKRCMGLPGDRLEIAERSLVINGSRIDENGYIHHTDSPDGSWRQGRDEFGPEAVPPDHYFCLGDNRDNSNDSRFWGPVPREYVRGRAFMVYWSFDPRDPGAPPGPVATDGSLRRFTEMALHFFPGTRWERTFRVVR